MMLNQKRMIQNGIIRLIINYGGIRMKQNIRNMVGSKREWKQINDVYEEQKFKELKDRGVKK